MALGPNKEILQISVDKETKQQLKELAKKDARSISSLVNKLILDYIAAQRGQ